MSAVMDRLTSERQVFDGADLSNLEGRIQGNLDIPLNDQGRTESRALAEYLAPIPFKEAYSSHLSRATEVRATELRLFFAAM